MEPEMDEQSRTDLAKHLALYAAQCGVNQKMMQQVMPYVSVSMIRNVFNNKPVKPEHVEQAHASLALLKFAKGQGLLPVSPRSMTPAVIRLIARFLHLRMRLEIIDEAYPGARDMDLGDETLLNVFDQIKNVPLPEKKKESDDA